MNLGREYVCTPFIILSNISMLKMLLKFLPKIKTIYLWENKICLQNVKSIQI
jgi:uncharacterized protein involved in tolerance to divalent cations